MNNISSIKTRILEYLDLKGVSKYEFYKNSGITRSVLDKDSGISESNIVKFIAYAPGISLNWLIKGEGDMFSDPDMVSDPPKTYKRPIIRRVPLYNLEDTGGLAVLFRENPKPRSYVSVPSLPHCDGAVYVSGNSMYPFLKSGDIVMYKEIQNIREGLIWGEMYLVGMDLDGEEHVSVQRMRKSKKGQDHVKLVSENPDHEARDIQLDRILALGLVKASIHFNTM